MHRPPLTLARIASAALRAALLLLCLAGPVLATSEPATVAGVIEAPAAKGKGVGFVLLVSLQRA